MTSISNAKEIFVFQRHTTSSLYEAFLPTVVQLDRYLTLGLFSFGLIGNILSIIVWWHPRLRIRESVVLTFICFSFVDLLQLTLFLVEDLERVWNVSLFGSKELCKIFQVLFASSQLISLLIIAMVCVQHYISLNRVNSYEHYKAKKWTYLIIMLITILSVVFSVGEGYFSSLKVTLTYAECILPYNILHNSHAFKVYYWLIKFFFTAVCIVALSVLCTMILYRKNNATQKFDFLHQRDCTLLSKNYCGCTVNGETKDLQLTRTVLTCGFFTVFSTIPYLILVCLEPLNSNGEERMKDFEVLDDPVWERYFNIEGAKIIFNEIRLSQCSVKILFYLICNKPFLRTFKEIFRLEKLLDGHKENPRSILKERSSFRKTKPFHYYQNLVKDSYPFMKGKMESNYASNECLNGSLDSQSRNLQKTLKHVDRGLDRRSRITEPIYYPLKRDNKPLSNTDNLQNKHNRKMEPLYYSMRRESKARQKVAEPIYYSVPRRTCCKKHILKYEMAKDGSSVNKMSDKKPTTKSFHNVYSEFEYKSDSSSNISEDSGVVYFENFPYYLKHDSNFNNKRHRKS